MANKILSMNDLQEMINLLNELDSELTNSTADLQIVLKSFDNEEIVNSFYASGNFGESEKNRIEGLLQIITNFKNVVTSENGLISASRNYINQQMEINSRG